MPVLKKPKEVFIWGLVKSKGDSGGGSVLEIRTFQGFFQKFRGIGLHQGFGHPQTVDTKLKHLTGGHGI